MIEAANKETETEGHGETERANGNEKETDIGNETCTQANKGHLHLPWDGKSRQLL